MSEEAAAVVEDTTQDVVVDATEDTTPSNQVEAPGEQEAGYKYAGKYNTTEELESGYKELTKKLREKLPEAPEEYVIQLADDLNLPEDINLGVDNPILSAMMPVLKELNISQEGFNGLLGAYLKAEMSLIPNPQEEINKLGAEANTILSENEGFVEQFSDEEKALFDQLGETAAGNKLINKIAKMTKAARTSNVTAKPTEAIARRDPSELIGEAMALKRSTPNFEQNTSAIGRYEKLMAEAAKLQLAGRK